MQDQDFERVANEAISKINFEKIHCAMTALNWTYAPLNEVPSIDYLKSNTKRMILDVLNTSGTLFGGGFTVSKDEYGIKVEFTVSSAYVFFNPLKID